jgi:hypothetical protein
MDVDLTPVAGRPSHSTVLWFEFLLDPSLLENHLQKETPGNAMLKFIGNDVRLRLHFNCHQCCTLLNLVAHA